MWTLFYGPVACLIALNVLYFGLTCWRLWYRNRNYNGNALRSLRLNFLLYIKLFLIMGIPWIFEIIGYSVSDAETEIYW